MTHHPIRRPAVSLALAVALVASPLAVATSAAAAPGTAAVQSGHPSSPSSEREGRGHHRGKGHHRGLRPIHQAEVPLVVGHRGASGYRPEHTLAAYELAAQMGADYIEPDLVSTKDGVLVVRHENLIDGTTDVAERPEFADRKTTKMIDGQELTGWFTEDFTLDELKSLRAKERLGEQRPGSATYDGLYEVPTFEEVLQLREELSEELGYELGIIPEIKHPSYFDSIGLSMEEGVVELLEEYGLNSRKKPVAVQSFEMANLKDLNRNLRLKADTVFLSSVDGSPYDSVLAGDTRRTYDYYESSRGMREAARAGVDILGPAFAQIISQDEDGSTGEDTGFVRRAHRTGLEVVPYTFRSENQYLYSEFRSSDDDNEHGDMGAMIQMFLDAGIDGLFSDHPDRAMAALGEWLYQQDQQDQEDRRGRGHGRH